MIKKITDKVIYIGCNDHEIDMFEGQYIVPNGMAYNSYVILEEKTAILDTMEEKEVDGAEEHEHEEGEEHEEEHYGQY